jgi:hypothetical protein
MGAETNVSIFNNTIYNCNGSIVVGSGQTGASVNGVALYGNTIHDSVNWDDSADNNHHDGIHLWAVHSGSSWSNVQIHDNNEYGDWGVHTTALVFIEANGGGSGGGTNAIYNNIFSETNAAAHPPTNGDISLQADGWYVLNNTFINDSNAGQGGGAIQADSGNGATVQNNILASPSTAINFPLGTSISTGDYNDYYNVGSGVPFYYLGQTLNKLADFISLAKLDTHSITTNPNLSASGVPASNSPVVGAGLNLTSLCGKFAGLCVDAAGNPRPVSGKWDMGAFQQGGTTSPSTFTLNVVNGSGSGTFAAGAQVTITANAPPSGQSFLDWTGASVQNASSPTTTLVMPSSNVTVTANYTAPVMFPLTVVSGIGSGAYPAQSQVTIEADLPPAGQKFVQWTGAAVKSGTSSPTTLVMPAGPLSVVATYTAITPVPPVPPVSNGQLHTLHVVNGSGSGQFGPGAVITIRANPAPAGQVFAGWTGGTVKSSTSPVTTVTMSYWNVNVTATYRKQR